MLPFFYGLTHGLPPTTSKLLSRRRQVARRGEVGRGGGGEAIIYIYLSDTRQGENKK